MEIAIAQRKILKDDWMIWIPPMGRPYWIEYPNSTRELTDKEIRKYLDVPKNH